MVDLNAAMATALADVRGEDHPQVVQIRRMVDLVDRSVAKGEIGICLRGKAEADFAFAAYLCDGWTGRVGSSLATAGHAIDLLPEELHERDRDPAVSPREIAGPRHKSNEGDK